MSSDPFADLACSLTAFADAFRDLLTCNPRPARGSPADREADGEPFAGDWGDYPSRDIFATTYLAATSCTDHLLAIASVLDARNAVFASYTLMRAAIEAAAIGCYLTDRDIDGRERLRRNMNYRLDGLCEQIWMVKAFSSDEATQKIARNQARISDFARSATLHGFVFHKISGPGRSAYLDKPQPSAMQLIGLATDKDSPELGVTYQRLLSSVAHSGLHGLARLLTPVGPNEGRPGEALAAVNLDARSLAVELVVGPLCAVGLAKGVQWFTGCDMGDLTGPANRMLLTWARVGELKTPGAPPPCRVR
jgi:hypothetical protein